MTRKMIDFSKLTPAELEEFRNRYDAYFFDMDDCLIRFTGKAIDGAKEAVNEIVKNGKTAMVVTDNCISTLDEIAAKINRLIPAIKKKNTLNDSFILGKYLKEISFNKKIYVIGTKHGLIKDLKDCGFDVIYDDEVTYQNGGDLFKTKFDENIGAVVVGGDPNFHYIKLMKATNYLADPQVLFIQTCCSMVAMVNPILPGTGSLTEAVKGASNRKDVILIGKGSECSKNYLKSLGFKMERCLFVGDQLLSDIHAGNQCGMDTLLVLTGTTSLEDLKTAEKNNVGDLIPTYFTNSVADLIRVFK